MVLRFAYGEQFVAILESFFELMESYVIVTFNEVPTFLTKLSRTIPFPYWLLFIQFITFIHKQERKPTV
jgi:hypothetical protein